MSPDSFAAAQERLRARRATREATDAARLQYEASHTHSSSLSQLPFPVGRASASFHSIRRSLQGREGTRPAFRVGQVDAELLDEELLSLLQGQAGQAFSYFGPYLADDWSREILLALRAILFKLSIWDHNATYGSALQNLHYVDARSGGLLAKPPSKWQKAAYGTITVLGRYAWDKWESWLIDCGATYGTQSDGVQLAARLTSWLSTTHSAAALVSFLVFLVNGRYRTITDRLLRLRLTPPSSQLSRQISFEYLNRQLVWHAFTEFLLFLLPLVGISRWRRWLNRLWRKAKLSFRSADDDLDLDASPRGRGPLAHLLENTCAICYQDQNPANISEAELLGVNAALSGTSITGSASTDIVNPYETVPCACIYCFVCIASKLEAEEGEGWLCLRCGELVKICQPWHGDVIAADDVDQAIDIKQSPSVNGDTDQSIHALTELEPRYEDETQEALIASSLWSSVRLDSQPETSDAESLVESS